MIANFVVLQAMMGFGMFVLLGGIYIIIQVIKIIATLISTKSSAEKWKAIRLRLIGLILASLIIGFMLYKVYQVLLLM